VALDGPIRRFQGGIELGTFVGFKRTVLINPYLAASYGPLGESESAPELGVNALLTHPKHSLAPHLRVAKYDRCTDTDCSSTFNISLGVALLERASGGWSEDLEYAFAGVMVGLVYNHQTEDNAGSAHLAGDFLGIEISGRVGADIIGALIDGKSDRDPYGPDFLHR
jgi:hypothetical protein